MAMNSESDTFFFLFSLNLFLIHLHCDSDTGVTGKFEPFLFPELFLNILFNLLSSWVDSLVKG